MVLYVFGVCDAQNGVKYCPNDLLYPTVQLQWIVGFGGFSLIWKRAGIVGCGACGLGLVLLGTSV